MLASSSSNSWFLALKVLLISAVGVSVAVTAKLAVRVMFTFALNDLPAIWSVVVSWLQPPYLYVIINGIIVIIVFSTRLQTNHHQDNQSEQQQVSSNPSNTLPPSDLTSSDLPPASIHKTIELPPVCYDFNPSVTSEPPVVCESKRADLDVDTVAVGGIEDDFISTRSMWNPSQSVVESPPLPKKVPPEFNFPVKEKQLVTFRFAHNRKPAKNIPEGGARAVRVLKPKKHETLDSTWKMITEGRRMPSTRQFRKSDTFENLHYDRPSDESKVVKKSETFKDCTAFENQNHYTQPDSAGKLKKDLSPSHDELNRRVEAFIKKFNDDMRLQRQESLNQYMEEMVDR